MATELANLEILSNKINFNSAVRHIKRTISIMEDAEGNKNLADLLYQIEDEEMDGNRSALVLNILLVDKMGYKTVSANLKSVVENLSSLAAEFAKWKGIDLIAAYHHPELGLLVANPKIPEELSAFGSLKKRELLVVYAGKGNAPADDDCTKAAELAIHLFEGTKIKAPVSFLKGSFPVKHIKEKAVSKGSKTAAKKPKPGKAKTAARNIHSDVSAAAPAGQVKMTPRYAVVVQNEFFHNGNVEAWKRIIASYNAAYPNLQVYIYYEGERIQNINALFKWGKVKHGSAIEFAVAGSNIKGVAKLQRYLAQGASHLFEAFLHGPVSSILKLF
ncbi:MAG: hypothetical protein LBH07_04960 [Treponema sp.]|nr:hypothetical protein [Treponema sp.]